MRMWGWDACVARVLFLWLTSFGNTTTPPPGDHKGPPNLTSSSLAPTDHVALCLVSRLRLMPIGCPLWASGPFHRKCVGITSPVFAPPGISLLFIPSYSSHWFTPILSYLSLPSCFNALPFPI